MVDSTVTVSSPVGLRRGRWVGRYGGLLQWHFPQFHWDYRCMDYPGVGLAIQHPRDCSVQAYRGHSVLEVRYSLFPSVIGARYGYVLSLLL
eukprot:4340851-Pyramimonas_sp.AAC.1